MEEPDQMLKEFQDFVKEKYGLNITVQEAAEEDSDTFEKLFGDAFYASKEEKL